MDDELRKPIKVIKKVPEIQHTQPDSATVMETIPRHKIFKPRQRLFLIKVLLLPIFILLVLVIGLTFYLNAHKSGLPNLLPKNVQKTLSFNLYYPNPSKLPSGYTLNKKSFLSNTTPSSLAVVYAVDYGNGQTIAFSLQKEPPRSEIQNFYSSHLALHTTDQTGVGTATIGAISLNQTLVSLPTNTNSWILITAPSSINQNKLIQVVDSIELAR